MGKNNEVVGQVVESLPNAQFRVDVDGTLYICYLSGGMKVHKIKIFVGDRVRVKLDPYGGKTTNRIVRRV